jgi:hypothetical protein
MQRLVLATHFWQGSHAVTATITLVFAMLSEQNNLSNCEHKTGFIREIP